MTEALQTLLPERLDFLAPYLVGAAYALAIFIVGWILSKWAASLIFRGLRRSRMDEALARFLASIGQYLVLAAAAITALSKVGIESTSLVALLGAAGLAIGLALQGSLSNFASGVMILLFRPFTIGHTVTIAGHSGTVKEIGLYATTVMAYNNDTITLPNSKIMADSIVNHSIAGTRRADITVGVAYGTDLARAVEVVLAACRQSELVLDEPEPACLFTGFGASSLDLVARPWALAGDFAKMQNEVRLAISSALDDAGIEIPFDQVVIHRAGSPKGDDEAAGEAAAAEAAARGADDDSRVVDAPSR